MIPPASQRQIRSMFASDLAGRVRIDLFSQESGPLVLPGQAPCPHCRDAEELAADLAALHDKLVVSVHNLRQTPALAAELAVDHVPAFVVRGRSNRPLRFFGMPTGNQFPVFIETIIRASRTGSGLSDAASRQLKKLRTPLDVRVIMTPSCQHSPGLVRSAVGAGLQNAKIAVTIIEVGEFPDLAHRYLAKPAVPLTVINEAVAVLGAMSAETLADVLQKTVQGKELDENMKTGPFTSLARRRSGSGPLTRGAGTAAWPARRPRSS